MKFKVEIKDEDFNLLKEFLSSDKIVKDVDVIRYLFCIDFSCSLKEYDVRDKVKISKIV